MQDPPNRLPNGVVDDGLHRDCRRTHGGPGSTDFGYSSEGTFVAKGPIPWGEITVDTWDPTVQMYYQANEWAYTLAYDPPYE